VYEALKLRDVCMASVLSISCDQDVDTGGQLPTPQLCDKMACLLSHTQPRQTNLLVACAEYVEVG